MSMTRRERLEARAERRLAWAEARDRDGDAARERVHEIADRIPFGQPILVGHHSEAGARADQRRIENGMRSAVENWRMADRHEAKAEGIARQLRHTIFSDDPDAIERLAEKLDQMEQRRERIKAYNATCRKGSPDLSILTEREQVEARRLGDATGAYPKWVLTNLGAEIRRNRERSDEISRNQQAQAEGKRIGGKVMTSRYGGTCPDCGQDFVRGDVIVWFRSTREAVCGSCGGR